MRLGTLALFPVLLLTLIIGCSKDPESPYIQTVKGRLNVDSTGWILSHEHILVDFIGAGSITPERWNRDSVIPVVLPYLREIRKLGVETFIDCTPAYLGRDPVLLKTLSERSGLHILTNTGWYGAAQHKYLPAESVTLSAEEIARFWLREWKEGVDGTGIKPGFIKISMDFDSITPVQRKLIRAAALTHLESGMPVVAHTGPAARAEEALDILAGEGVSPEAYVWVHAQAEEDPGAMLRVLARGCYISLDGVSSATAKRYARLMDTLKSNGYLNRILLSHDAGWYSPGEPAGGNFTPYTAIFSDLLPLLRKRGYSEDELNMLMHKNPSEAFAIRVRSIR